MLEILLTVSLQSIGKFQFEADNILLISEKINWLKHVIILILLLKCFPNIQSGFYSLLIAEFIRNYNEQLTICFKCLLNNLQFITIENLNY